MRDRTEQVATGGGCEADWSGTSDVDNGSWPYTSLHSAVEACNHLVFSCY